MDAVRIAVGIGGWPEGCAATPSLTCDIESVARSRGLIASGLENINLGLVIRANAIRLVLQARKIPPSTNPSGFVDVDGRLSSSYVGYISKAREIGCIQTATHFRPFDPVTEGEYAKMAVCAIDDSEKTGTMNSAPNTPKIPSPSITPNGSVVYIGG